LAFIRFNLPLNQDGFLHSSPIVTRGDKVTTYTPLTESNYADKGTLAIGKNLTVAYMPYKGYNFEDGAVISESAAQKMTHVTLHKLNLYFSPKTTVFNIKKFIAWYPDEVSPNNLKKLDERGLPKVGEIFSPGETVIACLVEKEMDNYDRALRKLDKYTFSQYSKKVLE